MLSVDVASDINSAIQHAVEEAGQKIDLSVKISAWFNALSSGNESLEDHTGLRNHIDLIIKTITLSLERSYSDGE